MLTVMYVKAPSLFYKSMMSGRNRGKMDWRVKEGRRGGSRGRCESRLTHRDRRAEVSLLPCVWLFWGCVFLFLLALGMLLHHTHTHTYIKTLSLTHTYKHYLHMHTFRLWGHLLRQVQRNGQRKASIRSALNYSTCD